MPLIKNGAAPIAAKTPMQEFADSIPAKPQTLAPTIVKSQPVPGVEVNTVVKDANDAVPDFVSVTNLQPDDMTAEKRRIQRSGLFQSALQSPALMQYAPTLEDYWALVRKAADEGLKWVNELSA